LKQLWNAFAVIGVPDPKIGYQRRFERVFTEAFSLDDCNLTSYFDQIQIQRVPEYAYGEEIAVLAEGSAKDRLSLTRSYETFTSRLISSSLPWQSTRPEFYSVLALETIEAGATADIVKRAAAKFPDGMPPQDRYKRQELLLSRVSPASDAFDELDAEFYGYPDNLSELLAKYGSE
jgi:Domain of unknown function (DUF4375)